MTRATSLPYLVAADDALDVAWSFRSSTGDAPLPGDFVGWDYDTAVELGATWSGDVDRLLSDCDLSPDDSFTCQIVWHCTSTNLRGASVGAAWPATRSVELHLPGDQLGGELRLELQVTLTGPATGARSPLAAERYGSVVWRSKTKLVLEGDAPRFPTEAVDFAASGLAPAQAAWYLRWEPADLHSAVMGNMRLYLNSAHPLMRRVIDDSSADPRVRIAFGALRHQVVRSILTGLLSNDDFQDGAEFGPGTIGETGLAITQAFFGLDTVTTLRSLRDGDPQRFEARVQDAVRLWADEL